MLNWSFLSLENLFFLPCMIIIHLWFYITKRDSLTFKPGTFASHLYIALIMLLIFVVIGIGIREIVKAIKPKLFKKMCESSELANSVIKSSAGPLGTAISIAIFWQLSVQLIAGDSDLMPASIEKWLPSIAQLIVVVAIVVWAFRLTGIIHSVVDWWDDDEELDGSEKTLITALESMTRFIIVIFGSVFIADALYFDLTTVVAGLGITGLALALAAKDTISNIFGAITVLLDRPFKVGDWIIAGSTEGEVIEIGLRTTLIRTSADTIITLPNATLVNESVENFGKRRWRRYQPTLFLDLDSEPEALEKFCAEVEQSVRDNENTMKEDDSWVNISAISKDSIEVGCNIYWNVSGSIAERKARQEWLIDVTSVAKKCGIKFFEPRIRNQRSLD